MSTEPAPAGKTKYFGRAIPPACALRGCYLTDDNVTFYCKNSACDKHRARRTKHSRYGRHDHLNPDRATLGNRPTPIPVDLAAAPIQYTKCPWCASHAISLRLLQNDHACANCGRTWT